MSRSGTVVAGYTACGWLAGVRKTLLVRTGYGRQTEEAHGKEMQDAVVVDDLPAAAAWILSQA